MPFETLEQMVVATAAMVRPPERLSVAEASEKYRWLNNPGSYVGPWQNAMTPYLVEPMEVLSSLDYTAMVFVAPAQCGKAYPWSLATRSSKCFILTVWERSHNSILDGSWRLGC